jgi:DnaK suppressor protein
MPAKKRLPAGKPAAKRPAPKKKPASAKKVAVAKKKSTPKQAAPPKTARTAAKAPSLNKPAHKISAAPAHKAPAKTTKAPAGKALDKRAPLRDAIKAAPSPAARSAAPLKAAPPKAAPGKAAPGKTATAAPAKSAAPAPSLVQVAPFAMPPGVIPRKPGRGTPKYFVAPVQAPLPPPTSRFADRFAPPRPPTRQMKTPENDTPREKHKADPKLANAWKTKTGRELSDAELLAMPDSEYMSDKQIDFFRMKLEALKNDLLSNAGETTEHLREDTSIVPDPADRATIEEEHALELRTRDRERKLLKKISQSLARLESGEYGFCDETGEPIGLGRLIARPTATLSLEAQQRRELKQKMFGD